MAIKVSLRQKAISKNRQSLYLDFYPAIVNPQTGELTRREFLGKYIVDKPKKEVDKQANKETTTLAEQIRQKRDNEINKPEIYSGYEKQQLKIKEKGEKDFVSYFKSLADKRSASNYDNWFSALHYLKAFTNGQKKFVDVDETFCSDFKDHLLTSKSNRSKKTRLSQNSAFSYFNKFKAALKQAYKDGYFQFDLNARIGSIKPAETRREFLTVDELNQLIKTECQNPILKNAALFSALTGLRFSDIAKMVWREIEFVKNNGYFIKYTQQKTGGIETMPISEQAYQLLGSKGKPNDKVFADLHYSAYNNKHLAQWIGAAGITKNITFHCFRHTYATLQLTNGTDIYTVSKMLGHRELKTTQIYAKVIDQSKREATHKIHLDF
jgi:integrase